MDIWMSFPSHACARQGVKQPESGRTPPSVHTAAPHADAGSLTPGHRLCRERVSGDSGESWKTPYGPASEDPERPFCHIPGRGLALTPEERTMRSPQNREAQILGRHLCNELPRQPNEVTREKRRVG